MVINIDKFQTAVEDIVSIPSTADKNLSPQATSGDGATTGLTISIAPIPGSYVGVRINGIGYIVGDGVTTMDCYFSADGGATARAFSAIQAGDTLYWNGVIAGFDLFPSFRVDLDYLVF